MTKLPNEEIRQMVPLLREEGFYEHEPIRKIYWPQYSEAQIKDAKETLEFIRDKVDECGYLKITAKAGRKLTDAKILAKAILVCEFLDFTEREAEGWLDIIGPFIGIYQHLDDRVIGEAYDNPEVVYILKQVFENSKESDGILAGDGTGIETSRKQNYETAKKTGEFMTSIVDSREIVQAFNLEKRCTWNCFMMLCNGLLNTTKEVMLKVSTQVLRGKIVSSEKEDIFVFFLN